MTKPARQVLAENVRALRERRPDLGGLRAWSHRINVGEATLHRILTASADVRLDSIDAVARGFGVPGWMLLVPDLDPENLPVALSAAEREFYRRLCNPPPRRRLRANPDAPSRHPAAMPFEPCTPNTA